MYKIYYKDENCLLLQGHALDVLKKLKAESVDCCITSPPYWALRDYGTDSQVWGGDSDCAHVWEEQNRKPSGGKGSKTANVGANKNDFANMHDHEVVSAFCSKCNAWRGDLGLEPTFDLYVEHLIEIFNEIKRVFKKSGTCWVVIGDTYSQSGGAGSQYKSKKNRIGGFKKYASHKVTKLPPKCLCSIPQRFQIAMCDSGWTLRNVAIWHKPSCLPSPTKDRLTVDFEYVLFFTKNKKYFFDYEIILEPYSKPMNQWGGNKLIAKGKAKKDLQGTYRNRELRPNKKGRHKRTVWSINPKPYKEAHFAPYPPDLIKPMILAGCPENGVVLDPFGGSGTTAMVSLENNRKCVSVDLKKEYLELHKKRLNI